jgi:hypothetical protein
MWKLRESRKEYVWDPNASNTYVGGQLLSWTYDYVNLQYIVNVISEEQKKMFIEKAPMEHRRKLEEWFYINGDGNSLNDRTGWEQERNGERFGMLKDYKLVPPDSTYIESKRGRAPEDGEYIYKFDEQQRTVFFYQMREKGLPGACEPWALGWIEEGIKKKEPRVTWYSGDEISAYIEEMATRKKTIDETNRLIWEAQKQKLPAPNAVPGHVEEKRKKGQLVDIGRGSVDWSGYKDMMTVKGLQGIERVPLVPGNYYTFEINASAETSGGGHVFAMYQENLNQLIVFDQNYGILRYAGGLPRLIEVVEAELNLMQKEFVHGRLGGWCISRFQTTGS